MLYPVGQITMPVLLAMGYCYIQYLDGGFGDPAERTLPWLENADIIDYLAVICKGDFELFLDFFIASVCALLWLVLLVISICLYHCANGARFCSYGFYL